MDIDLYKKHHYKLYKYLQIDIQDKANILIIGYEKEMIQLILNIFKNKKIKIICYDINNNYDNEFDNYIIIINSIENINDKFNIILLNEYNVSQFIIIFLQLIDLLEINGLFIINYEIKNNKEYTILYKLEALIYLNNHSLQIISNYNKMHEHVIGHRYNNSDKYIVLKNIKHKLSRIIKNKINEYDVLLDDILKYNGWNFKYEIPRDELDIEWKIEYYDIFNYELNNNIILYKIDKKLSIKSLNKIIDYSNNKDSLKNINLTILNNNFFIQNKRKIVHDFFINYINQLEYGENSEYLNFLYQYDEKKIIHINLYSDYKNIKINKKMFNMIILGSNKKNTRRNLNSNKEYFKKNIKVYQIYLPLFDNDIINIDKDITYIPNNLYTYNNIKLLLKSINNKIDLIDMRKHSHFIINYKKLDININTIDTIHNLTNQYILLLYFILSVQSKDGNLLFVIYPLFNDIYYEILYILNKFYDKIEIYEKPSFDYLDISIHINAYNFKGIDNKSLLNLKNICKDLSTHKYLKSIINLNYTNNFYIIQKYIYIILKNKINLYSLLYKYNSYYSNINNKEKIKIFHKIFLNQFNTAINYLIKNN